MMKTIAKTTVILICIILFNIQPILNRYYIISPFYRIEGWDTVLVTCSRSHRQLIKESGSILCPIDWFLEENEAVN